MWEAAMGECFRKIETRGPQNKVWEEHVEDSNKNLEELYTFLPLQK